MRQGERFRKIFRREKVDRLPVLFFGCWQETEEQWKREGMTDLRDIPGVDPDWEKGVWDCHGLVDIRPLSDKPHVTLEESGDYTVFEDGFGAIVKTTKRGSSIAHTMKHALVPTRESWRHFQTFLATDDPSRYGVNWEQKAESLASDDRIHSFMGGSLYGWLRDWMGVEQISYLMYDDPVLLEEMVAYLTEHYMTLFRPVLQKVEFDLVYFFEDCCGKTGPLFSPEIYKNIFNPYYQRLLRFYKENGVALALIDSDGDVDKLVPSWLESGFDILFPVEVGTWNASPDALRTKYGRSLNMFGGVDKRVIPYGEEAIRQHLLTLKPAVDEGGYIPIPDHRMPPECSYSDFLTYIKVFREVFNS